MKLFIGLMGVESSGMLVTPSGKKLFKAPIWLAIKIQKAQNYIAQLTWKFN